MNSWCKAPEAGRCSYVGGTERDEFTELAGWPTKGFTDYTRKWKVSGGQWLYEISLAHVWCSPISHKSLLTKTFWCFGVLDLFNTMWWKEHWLAGSPRLGEILCKSCPLSRPQVFCSKLSFWMMLPAPPRVLWLSLGVGLQVTMSISCPLVLSLRAHQRALWTLGEGWSIESGDLFMGHCGRFKPKKVQYFLF